MNSLRGIAVTAVISFAFASLGNAGDQDFTLVNDTSVEIHRLYAAPHSSDNWEEDILGEATLPSGESVEINFSPKEESEFWDLRVEDEEGNSLEWEKLNLLEISKVTLHYKKGEAWADTE